MWLGILAFSQAEISPTLGTGNMLKASLKPRNPHFSSCFCGSCRCLGQVIQEVTPGGSLLSLGLDIGCLATLALFCLQPCCEVLEYSLHLEIPEGNLKTSDGSGQKMSFGKRSLFKDKLFCRKKTPLLLQIVFLSLNQEIQAQIIYFWACWTRKKKVSVCSTGQKL